MRDEAGGTVRASGQKKGAGPPAGAFAQQRGAFSELDVAVFVDRDGEGDGLVRELQRTRARIRHAWPFDDAMLSGVDVAFCQFTSDLPQRLPWLPGKAPTALVVVLESSQAADPAVLHNCAPHGVIQLPARPAAVQAVLQVARSQHLFETRLLRRIEKLDENLRTMRSVERAKSILMASRKISEEEAYHFLRRKAMERRVPIGSLATIIVDSEELLG